MIYLDSCIVIYAVERDDRLGERVRASMRARHGAGAISPLVVHECLVGPLRAGDGHRRDRFVKFFADLEMLDLDLPAFVRAAELRAGAPSLRVPDALHLAAAQLAGCDALWTNDRRLTAVSRGLAIDVIGGDGPPTGSVTAPP